MRTQTLRASLSRAALVTLLLFYIPGTQAEGPIKTVGPFSEVSEDTLLRLRKEVIEHPKPVVSLTRDGAEYFLLFPNRLVLRWRMDWAGLEYSRLSTEEYDSLIKTISSMKGFFSLDAKYDLTASHHESNYQITLTLPDIQKSVRVYGDFLEGGKESLLGRPGRSEGPQDFAALYDFLMKYPLPESRQYESPYIELTVADYGYAPEESIEWPKEWPDLESRLTRKIDGYVIEYMILFPSNLRSELEAFLDQRRAKGAILMNGRKVHVLSRNVVPAQEDLESLPNKSQNHP